MRYHDLDTLLVNRAQRRRQEKLEGRSGVAGSDRQIHTFLSQGMAHHKAQDYHLAETCYQQALDIVPNHPEALHLLGLVAYHTGQGERALELIQQAIQSDGNNSCYFYNLGTVSQKMGKRGEACDAFNQAIALNPRYVEAHYSLGNVLADFRNFGQAIESYQRAITLKPSFGEAHNNMGVALNEQGQWEAALASYQRALELNSQHAEAYYNQGIVLQKMGRLKEGEQAFLAALAIRPSYAKAQHSLGLTYLWQENLDLAQQSFQASADLLRKQRQLKHVSRVSTARFAHDVDQLEHLVERGILTRDHEAYIELSKVLEVLNPEALEQRRYANLDSSQQASLAASLGAVSYMSDCSRLTQGALNPNLDVEAIEARYFAQTPEVMYVDSLLSEEALKSLRKFCLESTIWKHEYENGYLGAFLGEGFSTPLLLQISEELRLRFPRVFQQHRLKQAWAFKCDSTLQGLNIHADAAAVNVNFWITEDTANLDSGSGGLVVWDKEAPAEWNFQEYNSQHNKPNILKFLQEAGAKKVVVPYRSNRAIIFNSDLFHETDQFHFKDPYECRRVNITLLYGNRGSSS